jgi:hypothetical protein
LKPPFPAKTPSNQFLTHKLGIFSLSKAAQARLPRLRKSNGGQGF